MEWKEFLKPDWKKLIVFFVLIFIILNEDWITISLEGTLVIWIYNIFYIFHPFFRTFKLCYSGSSLCHKMFEDILGPLVAITKFLDFLYLYLISCLIIWIYDKYKKKKK